MAEGLRILAVDDVPPALDELCQILREAPEVAEVVGAGDALGALKLIQNGSYDAVFLDISMPGLDGLELGSLLSRLSAPPLIVFVTAYDNHALSAYDIGAVDYVLKPVRADRLSAALARLSKLASAEETGQQGTAPPETMAALPVDVGGRTRYVRRSEVQYVEAHGDYVRLHTRSGAHVVRMPISKLESYWEGTGFGRVHRSFLVALNAVRELRSDSAGGLIAHTDVGDVPVSRRHSRELREQLLNNARHHELGRPAGRGE
ncbi:LytR/AlgR family response regulator transcription factor [Parasphingorhabdus pacifica]